MRKKSGGGDPDAFAYEIENTKLARRVKGPLPLAPSPPPQPLQPRARTCERIRGMAHAASKFGPAASRRFLVHLRETGHLGQ